MTPIVFRFLLDILGFSLSSVLKTPTPTIIFSGDPGGAGHRHRGDVGTPDSGVTVDG